METVARMLNHFVPAGEPSIISRGETEEVILAERVPPHLFL